MYDTRMPADLYTPGNGRAIQYLREAQPEKLGGSAQSDLSRLIQVGTRPDHGHRCRFFELVDPPLDRQPARTIFLGAVKAEPEAEDPP